MIRQSPGDLLQIEFDGKCYYLVVLTKAVMFGGNIVFAFHGDGSPREVGSLAPDAPGFNVCTDLLYPKKNGVVTRIGQVADLAPFWRTRYAKGTTEYRKDMKAKEWWIYKIDDLQQLIVRTSKMTPEYVRAMDRQTSSFDLVAQKILEGYSPEQNPHL